MLPAGCLGLALRKGGLLRFPQSPLAARQDRPDLVVARVELRPVLADGLRTPAVAQLDQRKGQKTMGECMERLPGNHLLHQVPGLLELITLKANLSDVEQYLGVV